MLTVIPLTPSCSQCFLLISGLSADPFEKMSDVAKTDAAVVGSAGSDAGARVRGVTLVKPVVYGNIARYFGKKRDEDGHTHQWTVYLKPFRNEDMSTWVKKVHFKLHDSYANQNRIVMKPPFEVTETGWGEFEIQIKIHFQDPNERPITLYHILKLFDTDPVSKQINVKKNLVSEFYEEIVFQDPTVLMQQLLSSTQLLSLQNPRHETDFEDKREKTMIAITNARNKVSREVNNLKERLKNAQEEISRCKEEISRTAQETEVVS